LARGRPQRVRDASVALVFVLVVAAARLTLAPTVTVPPTTKEVWVARDSVRFDAIA
jgi:hypothetical protein